jgi:hypothetical protein
MELSEAAREALSRFFRHLPEQDDLTLIVLKGHLLVEQQMRDIVRKHAPECEVKRINRVTFSPLTRVTRALVGPDALVDDWWQAIDVLNKLRNQLAHELESTKVEALATQFSQLLRVEDVMGSISLAFGLPDTPEQRFKAGVALLCGRLLALA